MTLEFTLLMALVGVLLISTLNGEGGLMSQFQDNKPALAVRMERQMTVGRCFEIPEGGGQPCGSRLWREAAPPE